MLRHAFHAMGTEFELLLDATDDAPLAEVEHEVQRLEGLLSRFRRDSELSRLNAAGELRVGPELLELTELALDARTRTAGRFDPTVHDALVAAGYDRSFELLDDMPHPGGATTGAPCGGDVRIDRATRTVALEPGYRLDLGGIAKGWTADRVLQMLAGSGPALVNAGGDIAATGAAWPVGVEAGTGTLTLELDGGGLATSGRDRRRWTQGGRSRHHVIDPRTGQPAGGELLTVTVAAGSASEAEVLATSLFLAGSVERAAAEADARTVPVVLVGEGGGVTLAGGLA
jgi:thiamine biosynthesis lipoprotein